MTPQQIKAALIIQGIPLKEIAEDAKCDRAQVTRCINGTGLYLRVRKVIAKKLDKPVESVFRQHPKPKRRVKIRATTA